MMVSKDDTGLSVSKAVYGAPLTVPGEFLESPELLPSYFLHKIKEAVAGFAMSPPYQQSLFLYLRMPLFLPWHLCTVDLIWF